MNHAVPMCALERIRQLDENPVRLGAVDAPLDAEAFRKRDAANVSHDEVPDSADFTKGVEWQDACVRQLGSDASFAAKAPAAVRGGGGGRPKHLDRDEALERTFARQIDRTHTASAERSHDLVLLS